MHRTAVLVGLGIITAASAAHAGVIADYLGDYQTVTPKPGWKYQYGRLLTVAPPYTNLAWDASTFGGIYDQTGSGYPGSGDGDTSILSPNIQTATSGAVFVLADYTVGVSGTMALLNLNVDNSQPGGGGADGIEVVVKVNNGAPIIDQILGNNVPYSVPVTALGNLNIGDTVYVGIGPNGNDFFDGTTLSFEIATVPEPASLSILAVSSLALLSRRRKV